MSRTFHVVKLSTPIGNAKFRVEGNVNGKRERKFFLTRELAETYQKERNIQLRNEGLAASAIPDWLRGEALRWNEELTLIGATIADAAREYLRNHDKRSMSVTVKAACETYLRHQQTRVVSGGLKHITYAANKKNVDKFDRAFSTHLICDINSLSLQKWIDSLPLALTSRENLRLNLSGLFSYAVKYNWVRENPLSRVEVDLHHATKTKRVDILTIGQASKLLEVAPAHLVPAIALGLFAGMRPNEILRMDWSMIDWQRGIIDAPASITKTAQQRDIPLSDNLVAWLSPYAKRFGRVCDLSEGRAREAITAAGQLAGICGEGAPHKAWPKDCLRHSYGSYEYARTENAPQTAARMGHMDVKTFFKYYRNRVPQTEGEAFGQIRPPASGKIVSMA